jgi:hypothetical protein
MTFLAAAVLLTATLFALATSVNSFLVPRQFAQRLGFAVSGADGINEIRAQYGGFFLAVAVSGASALSGVITSQAGLIVLATVFGGLIFGRLASLALDRDVKGYGATIRALFIIDSIGLAASLAALVAEAGY